MNTYTSTGKRKPFTLRDMERDCPIENGCYRLDGQTLGSRIHVPAELATQYPYNASAYTLMQQLRGEIFERGTLEFPGLPVNKSNYTLAQRAPKQHGYSPNPYMTDIYQFPHQDTPPYPTGFWLAEQRRYFSTWVISLQGLKTCTDFRRRYPQLGIEELHRALVPASLLEHSGLLLNRNPGLLLIDNSNHRKLYHARTCNFAEVNANPAYTADAAMYAFNEIGLLNYIDTLDIRRGEEHRDPQEARAVSAFMAAERL